MVSNVKTLVSKIFEPGASKIQWDVTDAGGNKLPGGIYFFNVTSGNRTETGRMVLIR
jgi:flagellar hook assembly protein FlgD